MIQPTRTGLHVLRPEPGVYRNVSWERYRKIDAVNQSSLKNILVSPHEYQAKLERDLESKALMAGSGIHGLVLEPRSVGSKFAVWPGDRRGLVWQAVDTIHDFGLEEFHRYFVVFDGEARRGKVWTTFKDKNAGMFILTQTEWEEVNGFISANTAASNPFQDRSIVTATEWEAWSRYAEAVKDSPYAAELTRRGPAEWNELTLVWEEEGILCKARIDRASIVDNRLVIRDLKTTREKTRADFARAAHKLGYDFQAAWYLRGIEALTGKRLHHYEFLFYTIEHECLDVGCYYLPEEGISCGRLLIERALKSYRECQALGIWPGACPVADELTEYRAWKLESELGEIEDLQEEPVEGAEVLV